MENEQRPLEESRVQLHRTHLWDYFELHAKQRIALFRFYTLIFGLFITSSGFVLVRLPTDKKGVTFDEILVGVLVVVFFFLTVVFHFLDRRNRQLIKISEEKIINFEDEYLEEMSRIFSKELQQKSDGSSCIGHSACFTAIFIGSYVISASVLIYLIYSVCSR